MRFPRNAKIFRGQSDAAPYAGMFFLLLLLYLFSLRSAFTPHVKIDLPVVDATLPGIPGAIAVVAIDQDDRLYFKNQEVPSQEELLKQLRAAVSASPEPMTLLIQGDKNATHGAVEYWVAAATALGFERAATAARPAASATNLFSRPIK